MHTATKAETNVSKKPYSWSFCQEECHKLFGELFSWPFWQVAKPDDLFEWATNDPQARKIFETNMDIVDEARAKIEAFALHESASLRRYARGPYPDESLSHQQARFIMDIVTGVERDSSAWNRRFVELDVQIIIGLGAIALAAMHLWNIGQRDASTRTVEEDVRDETHFVRAHRLAHLHSLMSDAECTWLVDNIGEIPTLERREQLRALAAFIRYVELTDPKKIDQLADEAMVESFPRH